MKSIIKKLPFAALAILTLLTACSKDDDKPVPEPGPTVEEFLISGRWYFESQTNLVLNDCEKQSNWRFLSNGNLVQEVYSDVEGECEIVTTAAGTHGLLSDEALVLTYGTTSIEYTVITIDETELIVQFSSGGGTPITIVLDKNPGDG